MKQKMFRLTESEINTIKRVAEERNCTQTDVIRLCISQLESDIQEDISKNGSENLWKELFLEEHEKLLALTEKVAESLQASQTLQAMDKPALESSEQKKSRLQRLREAWRG